MKTLSKSLIAASLMAASLTATAGISANVGLASEYWFRGIEQTSDASASAGLDYEHDSGLYAGTWLADVGDGLEYDFYAGFANEIEGFSYSIGYTGYYYTSDTFWDGSFQEINLGAGYGPVSVEYTLGTEDLDNGAAEADYSFLAVTGEYNDFYLTYGKYGKDYDGAYVEAGYGFSVAELDMGVSVISQDKDLGSDEVILLTLSKSFDL